MKSQADRHNNFSSWHKKTSRQDICNYVHYKKLPTTKPAVFENSFVCTPPPPGLPLRATLDCAGISALRTPHSEFRTRKWPTFCARHYASPMSITRTSSRSQVLTFLSVKRSAIGVSARLTPHAFFSQVVRNSPENGRFKVRSLNVCAEIHPAFVWSARTILHVFASQSHSAPNKIGRLSLRPRDFPASKNKFDRRNETVRSSAAADETCSSRGARGLVRL
jgi:hypothetical protein